MSEIGDWLRRKALGWFLEFRLIPVLLWSYTSVGLGTALAFAETGSFDLGRFVVALALAGLVQGWVTHSINEIYDWRSGTDRDARPRALSGGSKVRNLSLLGERDLWLVFAVSSAGVILLAAYAALAVAAWLLLLIGTAYVLGLAYTLPPFRTAYRPFLGEGLGGFPGVLLAGLGAFAIQTGTLSWTALVALSAHALICSAMLVVHHYMDAPSDAQASPPKRTTVVALGPGRAKIYAASMAAAATALYLGLGLGTFPAFLVGAAATLPAVAVHLRVRPEDLRSVTRSELRIIQLGVGAGLGVATVLAPFLWPLLPMAAAGYAVHLLVVSPPAELARAWRRAPRKSAEDANSAPPLSEP